MEMPRIFVAFRNQFPPISAHENTNLGHRLLLIIILIYNENHYHLSMCIKYSQGGDVSVIKRNFHYSFRKFTAIALGTAAYFCISNAIATEAEHSISIQGHRFQPAELVVASGQKIKLSVENRDATPEEFESHDLNREKLISGNSSATIFVGPLSPGRYRFYGEFNEKSAQGVIVAQ